MSLTSQHRYHFVSHWQIPAETQRCWEVLCAVGSWPQWWPGMREAVTYTHTSRPANAPELTPGARARVRVGSPLGFTLDLLLTLSSYRAPHAAALTVAGDLTGTAGWSAAPEAWGTSMTIDWQVRSDRAIVNACRPLAGWAHGSVMAAGQEGLIRATQHSPASKQSPTSQHSPTSRQSPATQQNPATR